VRVCVTEADKLRTCRLWVTRNVASVLYMPDCNYNPVLKWS